ncbi:Serine/threonine-protein kinase PknD [Sulfuracidifex tepidarius]|uniref:Serine/threonine-protein kinase PknD n=1 Tax=Sulfuracidifex tepidarius TaxID=1294262 RepID=A0A510E1I1_9CREN|nr:Serine/threonine-protein kinase PknD [Sulfuracidifex tepidarius]
MTRVASQVANALQYVHSQGYVHLDVKPNNVFLLSPVRTAEEMEKVEVKLGDLGSATRIGKDVGQLTLEYATPEQIVETASPKMDVFSLGMTIYVSLTRRVDRPDTEHMRKAFSLASKGMMKEARREVDEAKRCLSSWEVGNGGVGLLRDPMLKRMLSPNPWDRPSMKEVTEWLSNL